MRFKTSPQTCMPNKFSNKQESKLDKSKTKDFTLWGSLFITNYERDALELTVSDKIDERNNSHQKKKVCRLAEMSECAKGGFISESFSPKSSKKKVPYKLKVYRIQVGSFWNINSCLVDLL